MVVVSWYSWRCLSCGLGASCVWGLAYHPTTRACLRVCTRACLVWYRRGEALSPASLPSVGDRVCCVVFVRFA